MTRPKSASLCAFESLNTGAQQRARLRLRWEVSWDPISSGRTPDEVDAVALLRQWVAKQKSATARVLWTVQGDGIFEAVPFLYQPSVGPHADFLAYYSWPIEVETGKPLRWAQLPVIDKLWNKRRSDTGGFIQQVTGWKPGPFQTALDWPTLFKLSGLESMIPDRIHDPSSRAGEAG